MGLKKVVLQPEGVLETLEGRRDVPLLAQGETQVEEGFGETRVDVDRFLKAAGGVLRSAEREHATAQIVEGVGVVWVHPPK